MTHTITKAASEADGVHRLIDMVVEEVSLVDRAANKHRFLIVKRDDAMDDDTTLTEVATATVEDAPDEGPGAVDDDSALGAAVAALESLTDVVELLSSLGGDATDPRLAKLAEQLGSAAEQLLARIGVDSEEDDEAQPVEARATTPQPAGGATAKLRAGLAAMKAASRRLSAGCAKPAGAAKPAAAPKAKQAAAEVAVDVEAIATAKGLTSVSESLKQLTDVMKAQQQRLTRLEKQSGLPNSAAPAEHPAQAEPEDLGWPMDLNKPMDRESVDKALSFHDV